MPKQMLIDSHAKRKLDGLLALWQMLLEHPQGIHVDVLTAALNIDRASMFRYFHELGARPVLIENARGKAVRSGLWTVDVTAEDIRLAQIILSRSEGHE